MSDPENPSQPLIHNQPAPNTGAPQQSGSSSRAWKVAGITVLACILIMGQASIAYFLLSQNSEIKALEQQNNDIKLGLRKGSSVSVPMQMQMHLPMDVMQMKLDDTVDDDASTDVPAPPQHNCLMEAAGIMPVPLPGYRPRCDKRGFYEAKQCFQGHCWCVDPFNGNTIPGSLTLGDTLCSFIGYIDKPLPDIVN